MGHPPVVGLCAPLIVGLDGAGCSHNRATIEDTQMLLEERGLLLKVEAGDFSTPCRNPLLIFCSRTPFAYIGLQTNARHKEDYEYLQWSPSHAPKDHSQHQAASAAQTPSTPRNQSSHNKQSQHAVAA